MSKPARAKIKASLKDQERPREKFYAWLGEVLSTGMTPEDFKRSEMLFKKGISVKAMKAELEKPQNRRKK